MRASSSKGIPSGDICSNRRTYASSISYTIPERNIVSLNIYDVNGAFVQNLVNENLEPGFHSVSWDGTNANGSKVSAGMYFYIIKSGNLVSTQKMIFLK